MDTLRTPKPENKIENKDNILIEQIEKEPLLKQLVDDLIIESEIKPDNITQFAYKLEILRNPKPKPENNIEQKDSILIPSKEKELLNKQNTDILLNEGELKPNNQI